MNMTQAYQRLRYSPKHIAICLTGDHGIGKSALVKQVAKDLDVPCLDFRLSQNDVGDLKGMPMHVQGRTLFAPPEFMPLTKEDAEDIKKLLSLSKDINLGRYGDKGILFLDEINRASREVQQAAFELVLDRRMNFRSLPEGWRVVTAINADDDLYSVNSMELAFASRFKVIPLDPTDKEWFTYAEDANVHGAIVEFLRRYPDFLDSTKEVKAEAVTKGGMPIVHDRRAWVMFSDELKEYEDLYQKGEFPYEPLSKNPESLDNLTLDAMSHVGLLAATKFRSFVETDYQSLDANRILNNFDEGAIKHVKGVVKKGRIPELASYSELIFAYINKNVDGNLSKRQKTNLTKYLTLLPNEVTADFWQKFNHDHKDCSSDWYNSDQRNVQMILAALVKPDAKKSAK